MKDNTDKFHVIKNSLHIGYWQEQERGRDVPWDHPYKHYATFDKVFEILTTELGFVEPKRPFKELVWADGRMKSLLKNYKCAGNKYLRVEMHRAPACFMLDFYYKDSRTGRADNLGNYDFDQWDHATSLERRTFTKITNRLASYFESIGAVNDTKPELRGRAQVMWEINEDPGRHCGKWENYQNQLGSYAQDRDGKAIRNGEIKYFRDYSGRLSRGQVYHNINNMWWVVTSEDSHRNIACFNLFDATPEDFKNKRIAKNKITEAGKVCQRIGTKLYKELVGKGLKITMEAK